MLQVSLRQIAAIKEVPASVTRESLQPEVEKWGRDLFSEIQRLKDGEGSFAKGKSVMMDALRGVEGGFKAMVEFFNVYPSVQGDDVTLVRYAETFFGRFPNVQLAMAAARAAGTTVLAKFIRAQVMGEAMRFVPADNNEDLGTALLQHENEGFETIADIMKEECQTSEGARKYVKMLKEQIDMLKVRGIQHPSVALKPSGMAPHLDPIDPDSAAVELAKANYREVLA